MGREIRRVPPNWEHPKFTEDDAPRSDVIGEYRPCYDDSFEKAAERWCRACAQWQRGEHEDQIKHPDLTKTDRYYWQWAGPPPEPNEYRPAFTEEPTWYQVYETVTEGTPVTPPFATKGELIDYLVEHGDFWDQHRGHGGRSREAATAFVNSGWAPSMMMAGGRLLDSYDSTTLSEPKDT